MMEKNATLRKRVNPSHDWICIVAPVSELPADFWSSTTKCVYVDTLVCRSY